MVQRETECSVLSLDTDVKFQTPIIINSWSSLRINALLENGENKLKKTTKGTCVEEKLFYFE